MKLGLLLMALFAALPLAASDELTVYELQPPATHSFAIIYDVTQTREGAAYFFNPIRAGSVATKESVIDRATGKQLRVRGGRRQDRESFRAWSARAPRTTRT
jgi:hypothetical protein